MLPYPVWTLIDFHFPPEVNSKAVLTASALIVKSKGATFMMTPSAIVGALEIALRASPLTLSSLATTVFLFVTLHHTTAP